MRSDGCFVCWSDDPLFGALSCSARRTTHIDASSRLRHRDVRRRDFSVEHLLAVSLRVMPGTEGQGLAGSPRRSGQPSTSRSWNPGGARSRTLPPARVPAAAWRPTATPLTTTSSLEARKAATVPRAARSPRHFAAAPSESRLRNQKTAESDGDQVRSRPPVADRTDAGDPRGGR